MRDGILGQRTSKPHRVGDPNHFGGLGIVPSVTVREGARSGLRPQLATGALRSCRGLLMASASRAAGSVGLAAACWRPASGSGGRGAIVREPARTGRLPAGDWGAGPGRGAQEARAAGCAGPWVNVLVARASTQVETARGGAWRMGSWAGIGGRMSRFMAWYAGVAAAGVVAGCVPASAVQAGGSRIGRAVAVPGLAALDTGRDAAVTTVSCASAGSCAAGGIYSDRHGDQDQGFVVAERNGRWGRAIEVPGLGALNTAGDAEVESVSCGSAGNCAAGGYYTHGVDLDNEAFAVSERNGRWGKAIEVPGLGTLNKAGFAMVTSMSCAPAGSCSAGGFYGDRDGNDQGFAVSERNGCWGKAIAVPGLAALNKHGDAMVNSVSCGTAGNCAAGGIYDERRDDQGNGFVAVERNGRWQNAIPVPGLAALNKGRGVTQVLTISCAPAGICAAGGYYFDRSDHHTWFTALERNGRWAPPTQIPGLKTLNTGPDSVDISSDLSISCAPDGTCTAGAYYTGNSGHQGFVTQNP